MGTIEYMTSIVTDISEASISERLAGEQLAEPFALRAVLDNIAAIIEPRAQTADLAYEVSIDDDFNPRYVGNKTKVQQILINFLNNSVKYTNPGGAISLRVFEDTPTGDKARVCFVISDTGIGIKKEYLPKLFKPFTREDKDDESASMSMGLGLSIAYNLIQSMHGDVSVQSEEGKGTTFTVHVQLDRYVEGADTDRDPFGIIAPHTYDLAGLHVLVAEDNDLNRTILGALLDNEGMTFTEAADGEQAVKIYKEAPDHTFDCILMDMRMPKLDGIRATEQIRRCKKADARTIPIIGVSANGFADDIKQARLAGIDEYTTKPIDRDSLLEAMSRLIKHKE